MGGTYIAQGNCLQTLRHGLPMHPVALNYQRSKFRLHNKYIHLLIISPYTCYMFRLNAIIRYSKLFTKKNLLACFYTIINVTFC
jgi:hypothetical protein